MRNKRGTLFILFLMLFSNVGGVSAIKLTHYDYKKDNNIVNYENQDLENSKANPVSRTIYNAISINPFQSNFMDMIYYLRQNTTEKVQKSKIKIETIAKIKNRENNVSIYCGKDDSDTLEGIHPQYNHNFELLSNSTALLNHSVNNSKLGERIVKYIASSGSEIDGNSMNTESTSCLSNNSSWSNAQNSYQIQSIASELGGASETKNKRINKIWVWMRGTDGTTKTGRHIWYHKHYMTQWSIEEVLKNKRANCCEQARLVVAIARAMGLNARYVHISGHVFTQIQNDEDQWFAVDTCYKTGYGRDVPKDAALLTDLSF